MAPHFPTFSPARFPHNSSMSLNVPYRGRIAPSPTGYLHLGHARTFWMAQERARQNFGTLILRNEDLDSARCQPEFVAAMIEDLHWFGFKWQEGRWVYVSKIFNEMTPEGKAPVPAPLRDDKGNIDDTKLKEN